MRTVNIARLKNNLSRYLAEVRNGEEIVIRDRKLPIAKIVPLTEAGDLGTEEVALVASGHMRAPKRPLPRRFWSMPGPRISARRAAAAVAADRSEN